MLYRIETFTRVSKFLTCPECPKLMSLISKRNAKDITFGANARQMMLRGVDLIADAVGLTLGPKGRFVILEQYKAYPKITKDGVTVAKSLDLKDSFLSVGAKLVQELAENTNKKAGDGTTTATVLARAIAKEGINIIDKGANPIEIRRGMMMAVDVAQEHLLQMSKTVATREEILQVAKISANGDSSIGELIAEAMDKVGRKGVILVNEGKAGYDQIEMIRGMQFESGYVSPYFINNKKKVTFKNAFILFSNGKITQISSLLHSLELCVKKKRPLVIVADEISGDALTTLIVNKIDHGLQVCAVTSPGYAQGRVESLRDMAVATGGTVFDDEAALGLSDLTEDHLGEAGEVIITKDDTIFLKGKGKKQLIEKRLQMIDYLSEQAKNDILKENLEERRGRLSSGVAIICVGGQTDFDRGEKKDRVTDALNATKAAIEEGIVAGGGTALIRCRKVLDQMKMENSDQKLGVEVVKRCLHVPCYMIAENAGACGSIVTETVGSETGDFGYDAINEIYGDMFDAGIIDPQGCRTALRDAACIASLITTAEAVPFFKIKILNYFLFQLTL
uniref:Putative mitochondrial chaperonin n=1 Tax=Rhodnius prolixus TaxID=13249 RepID=R4G7U6_RHOPR